MAMGWGSEPKLEELLMDCTLQLLMRRDGVDEAAIRALAAHAARPLPFDVTVEIAAGRPSGKHEGLGGNRKEIPCVL